MNSPEESTGKKAASVLGVLLILSLLFGAIHLARRNYLQGRGDREGAFRLALVMFGLGIALWLCRSHIVPSIDMFGVFLIALSGSLFLASVTWVLYMALEPWVRRRWPHAIITWSRLLSGQFRDPLVGRDILFGVILGVVWILVFQIRYIPMMHMGAAPGIANVEYLAGRKASSGCMADGRSVFDSGDLAVLLPTAGIESGASQRLARSHRFYSDFRIAQRAAEHIHRWSNCRRRFWCMPSPS